MFDELEQLLTTYFDLQKRGALLFANWLTRQIDRIPEPARKYLPLPKSERPTTYEMVEPGQYD